MSFCLDTYLQQSDNYEIHASKAGFKDCAMIIRFKADDIVYIKPGDEVLGVRVIGIPPIPDGSAAPLRWRARFETVPMSCRWT